MFYIGVHCPATREGFVAQAEESEQSLLLIQWRGLGLVREESS